MNTDGGEIFQGSAHKLLQLQHQSTSSALRKSTDRTS